MEKLGDSMTSSESAEYRNEKSLDSNFQERPPSTQGLPDIRIPSVDTNLDDFNDTLPLSVNITKPISSGYTHLLSAPIATFDDTDLGETTCDDVNLAKRKVQLSEQSKVSQGQLNNLAPKTLNNTIIPPSDCSPTPTKGNVAKSIIIEKELTTPSDQNKDHKVCESLESMPKVSKKSFGGLFKKKGLTMRNEENVRESVGPDSIASLNSPSSPPIKADTKKGKSKFSFLKRNKKSETPQENAVPFHESSTIVFETLKSATLKSEETPVEASQNLSGGEDVQDFEEAHTESDINIVNDPESHSAKIRSHKYSKKKKSLLSFNRRNSKGYSDQDNSSTEGSSVSQSDSSSSLDPTLIESKPRVASKKTKRPFFPSLKKKSHEFKMEDKSEAKQILDREDVDLVNHPMGKDGKQIKVKEGKNLPISKIGLIGQDSLLGEGEGEGIDYKPELLYENVTRKGISERRPSVQSTNVSNPEVVGSIISQTKRYPILTMPTERPRSTTPLRASRIEDYINALGEDPGVQNDIRINKDSYRSESKLSIRLPSNLDDEDDEEPEIERNHSKTVTRRRSSSVSNDFGWAEFTNKAFQTKSKRPSASSNYGKSKVMSETDLLRSDTNANYNVVKGQIPLNLEASTIFTENDGAKLALHRRAQSWVPHNCINNDEKYLSGGEPKSDENERRSRIHEIEIANTAAKVAAAVKDLSLQFNPLEIDVSSESTKSQNHIIMANKTSLDTSESMPALELGDKNNQLGITDSSDSLTKLYRKNIEETMKLQRHLSSPADKVNTPIIEPSSFPASQAHYQHGDNSYDSVDVTSPLSSEPQSPQFLYAPPEMPPPPLDISLIPADLYDEVSCHPGHEDFYDTERRLSWTYYDSPPGQLQGQESDANENIIEDNTPQYFSYTENYNAQNNFDWQRRASIDRAVQTTPPYLPPTIDIQYPNLEDNYGSLAKISGPPQRPPPPQIDLHTPGGTSSWVSNEPSASETFPDIPKIKRAAPARPPPSVHDIEKQAPQKSDDSWDQFQKLTAKVSKTIKQTKDTLNEKQGDEWIGVLKLPPKRNEPITEEVKRKELELQKKLTSDKFYPGSTIDILNMDPKSYKKMMKTIKKERKRDEKQKGKLAKYEQSSKDAYDLERKQTTLHPKYQQSLAESKGYVSDYGPNLEKESYSSVPEKSTRKNSKDKVVYARPIEDYTTDQSGDLKESNLAGSGKDGVEFKNEQRVKKGSLTIHGMDECYDPTKDNATLKDIFLTPSTIPENISMKNINYEENISNNKALQMNDDDDSLNVFKESFKNLSEIISNIEANAQDKPLSKTTKGESQSYSLQKEIKTRRASLENRLKNEGNLNPPISNRTNSEIGNKVIRKKKIRKKSLEPESLPQVDLLLDITNDQETGPEGKDGAEHQSIYPNLANTNPFAPNINKMDDIKTLSNSTLNIEPTSMNPFLIQTTMPLYKPLTPITTDFNPIPISKKPLLYDPEGEFLDSMIGNLQCPKNVIVSDSKENLTQNDFSVNITLANEPLKRERVNEDEMFDEVKPKNQTDLGVDWFREDVIEPLKLSLKPLEPTTLDNLLSLDETSEKRVILTDDWNFRDLKDDLVANKPLQPVKLDEFSNIFAENTSVITMADKPEIKSHTALEQTIHSPSKNVQFNDLFMQDTKPSLTSTWAGDEGVNKLASPVEMKKVKKVVKKGEIRKASTTAQYPNQWDLLIRTSNKKKSDNQKYWSKVIIKMYEGKKMLLYKVEGNDQLESTPFQEISLLPSYAISDVGAQKYDLYGKILVAKLQHVMYREKITSGLSVTLNKIQAVSNNPQSKGVSGSVPTVPASALFNATYTTLLKIGSFEYYYIKAFVKCVQDAFFKLPAHLYLEPKRTSGLVTGYATQEITIWVNEEYSGRIVVPTFTRQRIRRSLSGTSTAGGLTDQRIRVRMFCLAFLNAPPVPLCEVGMNDERRAGCEVVGRKDIMPCATDEWIKLNPKSIKFNPNCVARQAEGNQTSTICLHPPDAIRIEFCRFSVPTKENFELPLNVKINVNRPPTAIYKGRQFCITCDITPAVNLGIKHCSLTSFACENVAIYIPIPIDWIYMFREEKTLKFGTKHSTLKVPGKIKGLSRFLSPSPSGSTADNINQAGHENNAASPLDLETTIGLAKYEHVYKALVWRILKIPDIKQNAYKTHKMVCTLRLGRHDVIPQDLREIMADASVELEMATTFASRVMIRSISVSSMDEVEKSAIYGSKFDLKVAISHTEKVEISEDKQRYIEAARKSSGALQNNSDKSGNSSRKVSKEQDSLLLDLGNGGDFIETSRVQSSSQQQSSEMDSD